MGKRLEFKTVQLMDMVSTFDSMYTPDKLYDYSNYITLYARSGVLFGEMCVILGGASNDALVRLYRDGIGDLEFDRLVVNFGELLKFLKNAKGETTVLEIEGNALKLLSGKSTHLSNVSTVNIPSKILNTLDNFFTNDDREMVDFSLLSLYNNMNDIGSPLTLSTLKPVLYGIMHTSEYLLATNGFYISSYLDSSIKEPFLFPKHSIKIFKTLPKLEARYAIHNRKIFIEGLGYQCYIGEWSKISDYKYDVLINVIEDNNVIEVNNPSEVIEAAKACLAFQDIVHLYLGKGYAISANGKHKVEFPPTETYEDVRLTFHRDVFLKDSAVDSLHFNIERMYGKASSLNKVYIFLGMRYEDD
jgi:hypothetical protein